MPSDPIDELRTARTSSLGWLLGYGFGLLDHLVVEDVRMNGHPEFGGALATLTKAMPPSGRATIVELAARARVSKQAMSQIVAKMRRLSYVRVRPDPEDARRRIVSYSAKGKALARAIVEAALRIEAACRAELGEHGDAALRRGLRKVIVALEREIAEGR